MIDKEAIMKKNKKPARAEPRAGGKILAVA